MYQTLVQAIRDAGFDKMELLELAKETGINVDETDTALGIREEFVDTLMGDNDGVLQSLRTRFPRMPDTQRAILFIAIVAIFDTAHTFYGLLTSGDKLRTAATLLNWRKWVLLLLAIAPLSVVVRTIKVNMAKHKAKHLLKVINLFHSATPEELAEFNVCKGMSFLKKLRYCMFSLKDFAISAGRGGWAVKPMVEQELLKKPQKAGVYAVLKKHFQKKKQG